jgi:plastocyanin
MCYANVCVPTAINGCSISTATDLTGQTTATVDFGGGLGLKYAPACIKVKAGTVVTFNGGFASHPLQGGVDLGGTGVPATTGPFVTVTNTGTTANFTMSSAGTFPYYCTAHVSSGMEGAIFVVP